MTGIKIKGIDQAIKSLRKFQREFENELFDGVLEAARPVATEIRNRTPKGPTGRSRQSIKFGRLKRRVGRNVAAYVRVDRKIAPHFHFNEFGTVNQSPRPSFRPVVDQVNAGTFAPVTAAGKRAIAKFKP